MPPLDAVSLAYATVAGVTGGIAVLAWRSRPNPGATSLSVLMAAVAAWNASLLGLDLASTYLWIRVGLSLVFVAPAVTTAAFFAFALEYTGYEQYLRPPYVFLLAVEPAAVAVMAATNDLHSLFWADVYRTATGAWTFDPGLGSTAHLVYAYALVAVGTLLILQRLYTARAVHRRQTLAILVGVLAPWFGNVLFVVEVTELGQVVGFAVTGLVVYWAITEYRLVDLTPVARATVLDELDVGVAVIDEDDRVTDSNRFCRDLFGIDASETVIGQRVDRVLEELPELVDAVAAEDTFETTVTTTVDGESRTLTVRASPLEDNLGRQVGRLLLFEDVTDERRRQEEIEQRNEQLREFASLVSHDLRNPLDVAGGYVNLMRENRREADGGGAVELDADYLDETADALDRMETIVDDVLTLAREGEAATDPETVSLRSTARAAWEHVDTREASLVVGTDAMVIADRGQLTRIFENLFRNAVEHGSTSPDSQARRDAGRDCSSEPSVADAPEDAVEHGGDDVTVSIGTIPGEDGYAGFYVADDGPGIPPAERDTVFETGVTSEPGGTGFGLAIVDRLADAHGWSVSITDSDEGGARFEFTDVDVATEQVPLERGDGGA